jgi:hypothetical protein
MELLTSIIIHNKNSIMKKYFMGVAAVVAMFMASVSLAGAHGAVPEGGMEMTHEQEVAQGGMLYQKIQSKEASCTQMTDEDFEVMGEYFMEQGMTMADHDMMNDRLKTMMGDEGEEMVHMNIGKHGSKCGEEAEAMGMMGGDGMNMNGMNMGHNEYVSYSPIHASLLWVFALIGLFSVVKMIIAATQKKGAAPAATPEVK